MNDFIDWNYVIEASIQKTIETWLPHFIAFWPTLKPLLIASLVSIFIWRICLKHIRFRSMLLGQSKRETKRQERRAKDWFDLAKVIFEALGRRR